MKFINAFIGKAALILFNFILMSAVGFLGNGVAEAVPISEGDVDDYDIESFINHAKELYEYPCNIYGGKYYKEKGVRYWTANFGSKGKNTIKFKFIKNEDDDNYIEWVAITHSMPKPTKNSLQEYKTDSVNAIKEIVTVMGSMSDDIMKWYYYDDEGERLGKTLGYEIASGLEKIIDQVSQGKSVTPYDHTSSVIYEKKTFNVRVYWSESQIFVAFTAK